MTEESALHTAARRYCEGRAAYWRTRYEEMNPHCVSGKYGDAKKDVFPRYVLLDVVLAEVEGLRPETLTSGREAREVLILAGRIAGNAYTALPEGSIEGRAMQQERDLFCAYIGGLGDDALARVTPMASRRTLTGQESKEVWERMRRRWGVVGGYWYPLHGEAPTGAIAFDADAFEDRVPAAVFQSILSDHGLRRAFELREYGPEYELDVSLLIPSYNGAEGYWTAGDADWLVYASHESSITVAGDWLVRSVQQRWPAWAEHPVQW